MTGVLLAGGKGTRLYPLTLVANKHLLPVYDRPMIYFPLQTLVDMGCDRIILVSGGEHIGGFAELLGGTFLGAELVYRVQEEAGGIAEALGAAEGLVSGLFPVLLGDNYLEHAPPMEDMPTIFFKSVPHPGRFGVYQDGVIIEKPVAPRSDKAVIGCYIYDERVFDVTKRLVKSPRGELEITDVNNWYLNNGAKVERYRHHWSDMGTFGSLLEVANYVK